MDETKIEKLLNIKTSGRDDTRANTFNYPYEPTEYAVLERLVQSGLINKKNTLIDYGSGKGRVPFFVSYETGCKSIGVEYDEIDCRDIFPESGDSKREGILIFEIC